MDKVGGVIGLTITSPLIIGSAIGMKLSSKGKVIFTQYRVGQDGRLFKILKLRTMVSNAEAQLKSVLPEGPQLPYQKKPDDPRITPLGKWIRRYSIDEFPQFLNILKGDMSLVGPRPFIPEEVRNLPVTSMHRQVLRGGLFSRTMAFENRESHKELNPLNVALINEKNYFDNWSLKKDLVYLYRWFREVFKGKNH